MPPMADPSSEDVRQIEALRRGDEAAFATLVDAYHPSLVRLAMSYVHDRAVAEEVAQETWVGVLRGLERFEGRSSLKTWIFRILVNTAKTRAVREGRTVPFSSLPELDGEEHEPTVDPDRFVSPDQSSGHGHWAASPQSWESIPEDRLLALETREYIQQAIAMLPSNQQVVITLRDIEGWDSADTCQFLGISEANQRVLLHRARGKVRQALASYLGEP